MRSLLFQLIRKIPLLGHWYWRRYLGQKVESDWKKEDRILVYQMGKVGSSTLTNSIEKTLPNLAVFHVHFLSKAIGKHEAFSRKQGVFPYHNHLYVGAALRKVLATNQQRFKVISAVRDPLSILLSNFFQNEAFFIKGDFKTQGKYNVNQLIHYLKSDLDKAKTLPFFENWFTDEFKQALGVDVFELPFDREKGYGIYNLKSFDLLILQTEKMNALELEIGQFLGQDGFQLINDNVRAGGNDAEVYRELKNTIRFSDESLAKVYSSPLVSHFYSENQIHEFVNRWSSSTHNSKNNSRDN